MAVKLNCSTKTAGVYILYCTDLQVKDEYVGKSIDIYSRIHNHKSLCNAELNKKTDVHLYNFIRKHGGFKCWEFSVLEQCPSEITDKIKVNAWLSEAEIKWIKMLEPTLNTHHTLSYKQCVKSTVIDDQPPKYCEVVNKEITSSNNNSWPKSTMYFAIMTVLFLKLNISRLK
jgi:hypothetical protein